MTEEFKSALTDFAFDAAAGGAIRHLCDIGMSAEQIEKELSYPVPLERIKKEMAKYEEEKRKLASGEAEEYDIVKEYDKYGRSTYRRVKKTGVDDRLGVDHGLQ